MLLLLGDLQKPVLKNPCVVDFFSEDPSIQIRASSLPVEEQWFLISNRAPDLDLV